MVIGVEEYKPYDNIRKGMSNNEVGMLGEKLYSSVLTTIRIPHRANPFDERYSGFKGVGSDIQGTHGLDFEAEVKNQSGSYTWSIPWVQREVVGGTVGGAYYPPRFKSSIRLKMLVVFGNPPISQPVRDYLKFHGIQLIQVSRQCLGYDPALFQELKQKLIFLIYKFKSQLSKLSHSHTSNTLGNGKCRVYSTRMSRTTWARKYVGIKIIEPLQDKITKFTEKTIPRFIENRPVQLGTRITSWGDVLS